MKFRCVTCGEEHDVAEMSFGSDAPTQWHLLTDDERNRSELCQDQCVIDATEETAFFVRGCLDIPIIGTERAFTWGVWVSLSEKSFLEMSEHWTDPDRENLGPYFGWLSTTIPEYPDTMYLKTSVHQRSVGTRPLVELEATAHPLAVHQREGIDRDSLFALVTRLLHTDDTAQ